jgi:predicted naringenin-chalcone synthase
MAKQRVRLPLPYGRDNYETWVGIEKSIRKFDRLFNKVEKFEARKFSDPDNYQRREKRMVQKRNERLVENYTYYFGGLTEEELQYRDYFETDLEEDPEDEAMEDH